MVSAVIRHDVYHQIGNVMDIWIVMIHWMKDIVMNVEMINSIVVMVFVLIVVIFVMVNLIVQMVVTNDNAVCVIIIDFVFCSTSNFSFSFSFFYFIFCFGNQIYNENHVLFFATKKTNQIETMITIKKIVRLSDAMGLNGQGKLQVWNPLLSQWDEMCGEDWQVPEQSEEVCRLLGYQSSNETRLQDETSVIRSRYLPPKFNHGRSNFSPK